MCTASTIISFLPMLLTDKYEKMVINIYILNREIYRYYWLY